MLYYLMALSPFHFERGARYMFEQIFLLFATTVFTTVTSVITKKLFNRWFDDKDGE